jgi:hypothetical protein
MEDVECWRGKTAVPSLTTASSQAAKLRSWTKAKQFAGSAAIQTGNVLGNAYNISKNDY